MMTLITGGTGFIGRHLVTALLERGAQVKVLTRQSRVSDSGRLGQFGEATQIVADLTDPASLDRVCEGVDTVFHLAGYAHASDANDEAAAAVHWRITVEGTRALLAEVQRAGVDRFIFVSSVKAMGEGGERQLDETSPMAPSTVYGRAKLQAERLILAAGRECGMHTCVLRLPLVYGPGHKGNLTPMMKAIDQGLFPPLPEISNRRSMVHVDDVVQALLLAAERPEASGKTYIVTDGQAYSTRQIYNMIRAVLDKPAARWAVPLEVLRMGARAGDIIGRLLGRPFMLNSNMLEKLIGSAWYSSERISRELGYRPTKVLADGLAEMLAGYHDRDHSS